MIDIHERGCGCSYCKGKHRISYGLNIPKAWRQQGAWFVIKFGPRHFFRWTTRLFHKLLG